MGDKSAIEWTDSTWNPSTGCTMVDRECRYCYIDRSPPFRIAGRRFVPVKGVGRTTDVLTFPERLATPAKWRPVQLEDGSRRPRRIFVDSLSDLFHEAISDDFIAAVLRTIRATPEHVYQLLTKRPERMRRLFTDPDFIAETNPTGVQGIAIYQPTAEPTKDSYPIAGQVQGWPLPNLMIGVTAGYQKSLDLRVPELLETPARWRFLSAEPLLGPLDLSRYIPLDDDDGDCLWCGREWEPHGAHECPLGYGRGLDWIIVGGESAGPASRRLVYRDTEGYGPEAAAEWMPKFEALAWVQDIRNTSQIAGVPFFFKQWGGPRPKSAGRDLDGREWSEFPPEVLTLPPDSTLSGRGGRK